MALYKFRIIIIIIIIYTTLLPRCFADAAVIRNYRDNHTRFEEIDAFASNRWNALKFFFKRHWYVCVAMPVADA